MKLFLGRDRVSDSWFYFVLNALGGTAFKTLYIMSGISSLPLSAFLILPWVLGVGLRFV